MSRRISGNQSIALAMALAMALVVSACSGEAESSGEAVSAEPSAEQPAASAPDAAANIADAGPAQPAAFAQCVACHRVEIDAPAGIGPHLVGVVGAAAGSRGDFKYSPALSNANLVWDESTLDAFLTNPQKVAPGTMMAFGGISNAEQRQDIISYLKTLK